MATIQQNLRYALRMLAKQPVFTAIVIVTFALGIGANTAVFSVLNAVLLRPLPFKDPQNLVALWPYEISEGPKSVTDWSAVSYPDFRDWRAQNDQFEHMAVYTNRSLTLTDGSKAEHIVGEAVSADLFALLGVQPWVGRAFLRSEDEPGNHVAILSYGLWQGRFGSDPRIVGKSITLDGKNYSVVGVMPAGFNFPLMHDSTAVELWTTVAALRETVDGSQPMTEQRGNDFMYCIARLKLAASLSQAQARMDTISAALRQQYPDSNAHIGVTLVPLVNAVVGETRPALLMLCAMAGCVLLVACVNVANLLLARSLSRQKEISIRAAVGAGRFDIVSQLLTESGLFGLLGGFAGLILAIWGIDSLRGFLPTNIPRISEISPDWRVLCFTGAVSLLVGMFAGLLPAWRASHGNLATALNEATRGSSEGSGGRRTRAALVVVEMVLALVLLASAGLLVSSFLRLQRVRPGFDPTNILTARVALPDTRYGKPEAVADFYSKLLERIGSLPGVGGASAAWWIPLSGSEITFNFDIQERPVPKSERPVAQLNAVALDYFKVLRMPLLKGRDFNVRDHIKAPPVVIVNEAFAREFFPGQNPVGKKITPDGSVTPGDPPVREIVGVVGDSHLISLSAKPKPQIYAPHPQFAVGGMSLFVRTENDPRGVGGSLRNAVAELDKDVPVYRERLLTGYLSASIAQPRFNAVLVGLFSAIALFLAAAGLFGVMSYAVTQRTQEIGIRLALGAQRGDVLRMILSEGMRLVAFGLIAGITITLLLGRLLRGLLYDVASNDPRTLLGVGVLLAGVALLACWWPARRASTVDPVVALRTE
jgi:putative ABC transport system permease protein